MNKLLALVMGSMLWVVMMLNNYQLLAQFKTMVHLQREFELNSLIFADPKDKAPPRAASDASDAYEEGLWWDPEPRKEAPVQLGLGDIVEALSVVNDNMAAMRLLLLSGSASGVGGPRGSAGTQHTDENSHSHSQHSDFDIFREGSNDTGMMSALRGEGRDSDVLPYADLASLVCSLMDSSTAAYRNRSIADTNSGVTALSSWKYYKLLLDSILLTIGFASANHMHGDFSNVGESFAKLPVQDIMQSLGVPLDTGVEAVLPGDVEHVQFSLLCLRVFATVESFYGCALPLFVEDDPELDMIISSTQIGVVEMLLFLMVMAAMHEERAPPAPPLNVHGHAAGAPNQSSMKGVYKLRCMSTDTPPEGDGERRPPSSGINDTDGVDWTGPQQTEDRNNVSWCFTLKKTVVESQAAHVRRLSRVRNKKDSNSFKESNASEITGGSGSPDAAKESSDKTSESEKETKPGTDQADTDDQAATVSSVLIQLVNTLGLRYFNTIVGKINRAELRAPFGLFHTGWQLKLQNCEAIAVRLGVKPFVAHDLMDERTDTASDLLRSSRTDGRPSLPATYEYRQCWLYVDSQLGDQLRLFTIKDRIMSFGVPMNTCQMFDLYKYKFRHPVVVVYEEVLSKFKHQLKSDLAPISSTIIVLCEQSIKTVDEINAMYDIRVTACLSFGATISEVAHCVQWTSFVAEPRARANADEVSKGTLPKKSELAPVSSLLSSSDREAQVIKSEQSRHTLQKFSVARRLENTRVTWNGFIHDVTQQLSAFSAGTLHSQEKAFMLAVVSACQERLQSVNPGATDDFLLMVVERDPAVAAACGDAGKITNTGSSLAVYGMLRSPRARKLKYLTETFLPVLRQMQSLLQRRSSADLLELGHWAELAAYSAGRVGLAQLSCWFATMQDIVMVIVMHCSLAAAQVAAVNAGSAYPGAVRTRSSEAMLASSAGAGTPESSGEARRKLPPLTIPSRFKFSNSKVYEMKGVRLEKQDALTGVLEGEDESDADGAPGQGEGGEGTAFPVEGVDVAPTYRALMREMLSSIEGNLWDMMYAPN